MQPFEILILQELNFWITLLQYLYTALQWFFILYNMFNNLIP